MSYQRKLQWQRVQAARAEQKMVRISIGVAFLGFV